MSDTKSLYEVIKESIKDGELPDTFSLPKDGDDDPNKIKWADGALDGVGIFHMGQPEVSDDLVKTIADAFSMLPDNNKAMARMRDFFAKIPPVRGIDDIQRYIINNTQTLDANQVYSLAIDCVFSSEVDMVKLGMLIIEIFNEPDERIKEIIRTLGLSDEFTIFSVFNMMTWENGNQEIFELAKKVHGWGRIHSVERLNPETQEIKDWLLAEGINNDVVRDYSALEVFEKVGIASLLKSQITDTQLNQIANVLDSMFEEGPVRGISALPENDAKDLIGDYIKQAEKHTLSLDICNLLLTIADDERFEEYAEQCNAILNSSKSKEMIDKELENGNAINLAKATGIPYKEKIFAHMKSDFDKGFGNCGALLDDDHYREQVIDIFRKSLPIVRMTGEPTTAGGYFEKYADYNKLAYLIQFLNEYPMCGSDLIIVALNMPIVQCRTQAIRTISEWCKTKDCSLLDLSNDLYQAVEHLKSVEVDDRVKKMIEENGL